MVLSGYIGWPTVRKYWELKTNPDDIDWLRSIQEPVIHIRQMKSKVGKFIQMLVDENNMLREELAALKKTMQPTAAGRSIYEVFLDLLNYNWPVDKNKQTTNGTWHRIK